MTTQDAEGTDVLCVQRGLRVSGHHQEVAEHAAGLLSSENKFRMLWDSCGDHGNCNEVERTEWRDYYRYYFLRMVRECRESETVNRGKLFGDN